MLRLDAGLKDLTLAPRGGLALDVDHYVVSSTALESDVYAHGDEFLALRAGDEKNSLWVYRSDYFPGGVEIVGTVPSP